jgi:hypothetical protein
MAVKKRKTVGKNKTANVVKPQKKGLIEPKIYLSINNTVYRAINPEKALDIAKKLGKELGNYKVHVIYGKEQISKRKVITVENEGKYRSAQETKQAIVAFLDKTLWMR